MADLQRKRCLYKVLGISRHSSPEENNSSYHRLALQFHRDKISTSSGGVASPDATAAFWEFLHAYEVLSDPKECSYYDSYRSQFLFSDSSFDIELYSSFSNSVFSSFSNTGRGFYKVYDDLFIKIYSQGAYFVEEFVLDDVAQASLIGNMESPYSQVTAFYNYWLGFCTVMGFRCYYVPRPTLEACDGGGD